MTRPPHPGPAHGHAAAARRAAHPAAGLGLLLCAALAGDALAARRPAPAAPPAASAPATTAAATPASAPAASAPAGARDRFTYYGLTPAAAGQRVAQAEAALGQALKPLPPARPRAAAGAASGTAATAAATSHCHFRATDAQPGVRYALAGDVITRIETRDARYATLSGVHVGDTLERAQQAYGKRLSVAPHPYFDKGRMLTVPSPDRRHALVMESNDQGRIITLRSGRLPEVGWLEGCAS